MAGLPVVPFLTNCTDIKKLKKEVDLSRGVFLILVGLKAYFSIYTNPGISVINS